jgi:hypothetical protein
MEILLGGFSAKTGKEDIFKPTARFKSFHKISKDIGIRAVNFVLSGSLIVTSTCSHTTAFINILGSDCLCLGR